MTQDQINAEIHKKLQARLDRYVTALKILLEDEFGRAAVRHADLQSLRNLIVACLEDGADIGRDVVADARYKDQMQASTP